MSRSMVWLVVGGALSTTACDNKSVTSAPAEDAGATADKLATADPKLERALQAAAAVTGSSSDGPPPTGVFPPGEADRRHSKGVPIAVEFVSDGSEPRVSLTATSLAAVSGPAVLEIGMQMGPRSALPTVDLGFAIGVAKTADGGTPLLLAEVRKAKPGKDQPGELPPNVEQEISAIAGTQIVTDLSADGRATGFEVHLGKNAHTDLFAQNAAEALMLAAVPLPDKPVGVGAAWNAEARTQWAGLDVIEYRAYRVKSIDGGHVTLTVDANGYATSADPQIQGAPKGATLQQFEARAQGEMEVAPGETFARHAQIMQRVVMIFASDADDKTKAQPGPGEGNAVTEQLQGQATFVRGDALREGAVRRAEPREPQ